jgi:pimeloyl-ACP methyl ester carboxylesterase
LADPGLISAMAKGPQSVVYFLHGLLSSAHYHFAPQVEAWKEELTIIPIDLPGHGHCQLDAQPRYFATALRYALGIMKRFGPGHVVAASMLGGPVAVRCALERPDLVSSLVLAGFVPGIPQDVFTVWIDGFKRLAAENPHLAQWYDQMHGRRWQDTLEQFENDVQNHYSEDICVTGSMLGKLQPPTLIANGTLKSSERAAALDAAQLGPAIRGRLIEGAGHIPSRDCPQEFNAVVRAFWEETAVVPEATVQR